jgi:hypothetical protein
MDMSIDGMNSYQIKILDELWACDTVEEMQRFLESKTEEELQEIATLREMLVLAHIDEEVSQMKEFPEVLAMLKGLV